MRKFWLAVASANHVKMGVAGGFMQVCHGKGAPLQRIKPGDGVVYYSPTETYGGRDILRAFTAAGSVKEGVPYQFDMGNGFVPFRRDVQWGSCRNVAIRPLLDTLDFTKGKSNWGYFLRFGLVAMTEHDFMLIQQIMNTATGFD